MQSDIFFQCFSSACLICFFSNPLFAPRSTTTISSPVSDAFAPLKLSLIILFALFLSIALFRCFLETTIPRREMFFEFSLATICNSLSPERLCDLNTDWNSCGLLSLLECVKRMKPDASQRSPPYADSLFLPLARRALIICRPALVRIRTRNPWFLLHLSLLGWKVLFMIYTLFIFRP